MPVALYPNPGRIDVRANGGTKSGHSAMVKALGRMTNRCASGYWLYRVTLQLCLAGWPLSASAVDAEVSPRRAAGDMATEFRNQKLPPSTAPLALPLKVPLTEDARTIEHAQRIFDNHAVLGLLMVDKGRIVYENYRAPAAANKPLFSWSMSKSLTAYTLGQMHCDGKIPALDQPAATVSPALKGTVFGEATLRHLLSMSSGGKEALHSGDHIAPTPDCKPGTNCDGWQMMRAQLMTGMEYLHKFPERGKTLLGNAVESGSRFAYSGLDTLALASVADSAGGFLPAFEKYVWNRIGAEAPGYWLLDRDNRAIAQAGFSAIGRDWIRLALFSLRQLSSDDLCVRDFMHKATSAQIKNSSKRVGSNFESYGYQTWIFQSSGSPSYWWAGYGGQRVGIDPVGEKIIVVSSYRENYMGEIYRLFDGWQRR